MSGPDVEGVLAAALHDALRCNCDSGEAHYWQAEEIAPALRAEVRAWLESEGAVSVAARAANDAPNGAWLVLPGPVNIARSLVQPALAALAEQAAQVAPSRVPGEGS